MRTLTILRRKCFVACLAKMRVYLEDAQNDELTIHDVPCRLLGTLKNGEEASYSIGDEAARIFVIADKMSKEYCNEVYPLPAGTEDVRLCGANRYNPANGNAFVFDGAESQETAANRKHGVRKGLLVLLIALAVGLTVGFVGSYLVRRALSSKPQTFTAENLCITLTSRFCEVEQEDYVACYQTNEVAVMISMEDVSAVPQLVDATEATYAKLMIAYTGVDATVLEANGQTHFVYQYAVDEAGTLCDYCTCIKKNGAAFWTVQFACKDDDYARYEATFLDYAASITFTEE